MELRIKDVIKEKGLTIQSLADQMGINRVNLSSSINGNPTVETLGKIADALNVPISDLFEQPKQSIITCPKCGTRLEVKEVDDVAERLSKEYGITPDQVKEGGIFSRFVDSLPDDIRKDILSGKIELKK